MRRPPHDKKRPPPEVHVDGPPLEDPIAMMVTPAERAHIDEVRRRSAARAQAKARR